MFFKPKIFISSVLSLHSARKQLDEFFSLLGAEVLLYEKNLTPSATKSTYRRDILDADFVIFIIGDKYGTETDSGKSGTHEEYQIIKRSRIPMHVYLKRRKNSDKDLNRIIAEIASDNVSYYYYTSISSLVERIKETVFVIAKEISQKDIDSTDFEPEFILSKAAELDYQRGMQVIRDVDDLFQASEAGRFDIQNSTAIDEYFLSWDLSYRSSSWQFIDQYTDKVFAELLLSVNKLHEVLYPNMEITNRDIKIPLRSGFELFVQSLHMIAGNHNYDKVKQEFKKFVAKYNEFKDVIINQKTRADRLK